MDTRIIFGAAGVIVGAGIGALITWRFLKQHYETLSQEEIDAVKAHYSKVFKEGPDADLSSMVAKYKDKVDELGYSGVQSDDSDDPEDDEDDAEEESDDAYVQEDSSDDHPEPKITNIWQYTKDHPHPEDEAYVITFEQFNNEHDDYDKSDLVYYEGDDILVDSQESPIDNVEDLIGPDALTRFGDGSRDKNMVYVRNDRIAMDFEVSRDERSYTEVIIGIQEPKKRKVHKMRDEE